MIYFCQVSKIVAKTVSTKVNLDFMVHKNKRTIFVESPFTELRNAANAGLLQFLVSEVSTLENNGLR